MYKPLLAACLSLACTSLPLAQANPPTQLPQAVQAPALPQEKNALLSPSWAADIAHHPILFALAPLARLPILFVLFKSGALSQQYALSKDVLVYLLAGVVCALVASFWGTPWQVEVGEGERIKQVYTPPFLMRLWRAFRFSVASIWVCVAVFYLNNSGKLKCVLPSTDKGTNDLLLLVVYPCLLAVVVWSIVWGGKRLLSQSPKAAPRPHLPASSAPQDQQTAAG